MLNLASTRAKAPVARSQPSSNPDVVGVYVWVLEDRRTACLKVMLARKNPETERKIPHLLEGYPVVVEVTGEIRPLSQ